MLRAHFVRVLLLLSCTTQLSHCQSPDSFAELTDGNDLPVLMPARQAPPSAVRLLDSQEGPLQAHLARHEGEILIEQNRRQYLFSGLSPLNESSYTLRLPTAVYLRNTQAWQALRFLPPIDLSLSTPNGQFLQLIAQYPQVGEHGPELRTLWRPSQESEWQAELLIRPMAKTTGLLLETKAPAGQSLSWSVRIARGYGEEHPIPWRPGLFSGITLALLPDLITLISADPLRIENQALSTQLIVKQASSRSGFALLFGRPAALLQPSLIARAQNCAEEEPQQPIDCFIQQEQAPLTARRLTLGTVAKLTDETSLAQQVYLKTKSGEFRSTFAIREGETLIVHQDEDLHVTSADAKGAWQVKSLPLELEGISLSPLAKGRVKLSLDEQIPAFVELRDAQHPFGISWQLWTNPKDELTWFSPHTALRSKWPFLGSLPAGDYQVKVYRGREILCLQDFTILPEQTTPISCAHPPIALKLSDRLSFRADPNRIEADLWAAADLTPIGPTPIDDEASQLSFRDPALGIGLRAFPVSRQLEQSWLEWQAPRDKVSLKNFAQFLRDRDPSVQILLECPPPGFSPADYEWLALKIQPDVLEMFGCPHIASSLGWLQFAQKLQQQMNRPLKFANALPEASWMGWGGMVPAMFAHKQGEAAPSLQDIALGRYSLGLRSELRVLALNPKQLNLKIRSSDTQYTALILQIADQNGVLSHHSLASSPLIDRELTLPLAINDNSRWLRVSLFGVNRTNRKFLDPASSPGQDSSISLLATSNYIDIKESSAD